MTTEVSASSSSWWESAIGYEVYIRSFADSNGDGVGDIQGLSDRLEHLAWLGVDLIWVTPFYPSPFADFGYDVADYADIDPLFGNLDEFDAMVAKAHGLGLRVMIDVVPNHSSDQHAWFRDAVSSIDAGKRDWYIWRDPAPDGGPPNNWITHFGGSAWTLDEASGQYYLHLFLPEQPDLNWANPAVGDAWAEILTFWLDRGVDGFRIDVTQGLAKDQRFLDNPELRPLVDGMSRNEQWDSFEHRYDTLQPETLDVFRRWRQLCEPYNAYLLGETYVLDATALAHFLEPNDGIHQGFWFGPMHLKWSPDEVRDVLKAPVDAAPNGVGWAMSSHDDPRAAGRYGSGQLGADRSLGLFTMFAGLPGTPFLYQGDELALVDGSVPPDRLRDPVSFRTGVATDSRDGCRTPMPWEPGSPMLGFTTADDGWLPMGGRSDVDTVEAQRNDPEAFVHRMRAMLMARRELLRSGLLSSGDPVDWVDLGPDLVSFRRGDLQFVLNAGDIEHQFESLTGRVIFRTTDAADLASAEEISAVAGSICSIGVGETLILQHGG